MINSSQKIICGQSMVHHANSVWPVSFREGQQEMARLWLHCDWKARPAYRALEDFTIYNNPVLWSMTAKVDGKVLLTVEKVTYHNLLTEIQKLHVDEMSKLDINLDVFALRPEGATELVATNNEDSKQLTPSQKDFMKENCAAVSSSFDVAKHLNEATKVTGKISPKVMLCDFQNSFAEPIERIHIRPQDKDILEP